MSLVSLCRALALVVLVTIAAPYGSATAAPSAPPTGGLSEARALIRVGKPEEALAKLRPLARGRTVHADVLFHIGVAAVGASQRPGIGEDRRNALLDEAITAFRTVLIGRPNLLRVRLELGRAFFLKGEDSLARRHFEQVLAGKPPAAVALNVNRFLNIMRARKRWSVRIGMALAPDSNISARTDEKTIFLDVFGQRLPFTYRGDDAESGIGIAMWAGGEYQYPLDPRWRLRIGGDFSRREYRSDEFDRMTLSGHLGPRWLIGRASEASVLASVRQSWLSDEEDWRDVGARVEGRHRLNRRTVAHLNTARHERRYEGQDRFDGPLTDISAGIGWVATPTMRIDAALGWGKQRTEQKRQRNSSRWLRVGATVQLPYGFTVGGAATLRWTEYEGNWAPFVLGAGSRSDLTRSLRFDVHNRALTIGGFSPQVSMVQEERTSNAQLHGYDRLSGEMRFVRLF